MTDLFAREQRIYDEAVNNRPEDAASMRSSYAALTQEYGRLLKQLRRVTKLSDKTAVNLNASKLDLIDKLLRMSSLAESSPNFVSYKKFSGECVYLNPSASILTGYTHDELMPDYIHTLFDDETAHYLRQHIPKVLQEKGICLYEVSVKRKDGEIRTFSACSFLVKSDEEAYGTIATDITEKKRIEAERLEALQKVEQANQAKSDFLSRMSHEMKTPMNAIIGMASLSQKMQTLDEAQAYFEKINAAATQLLGIIDDVLDMAKIYTGETEINKESFQVQALLDQVNAVMRIKFDEKQQVFHIKADADIPKYIVTDKQKLARAITNLLDNANKFTPEKGTIGLSVNKIADFNNGCKLRFTIEDDGIGIPPAQQMRIFKAFEQSDNSITRQYGGTGLGLAIAQRFINLLGGEISLETHPGKGARFSFTLTVASGTEGTGKQADGEPFALKTEAETPRNVFMGKRILLVDDVALNREILAALLNETGIEIGCAGSGREACEIFAANAGVYDLILMDIHMPEMNGYEAAKTIRGMTDSTARAVPIIAVTADVDGEKIAEAGINDCLEKPLNIDMVITLMKQYLCQA